MVLPPGTAIQKGEKRAEDDHEVGPHISPGGVGETEFDFARQTMLDVELLYAVLHPLLQQVFFVAEVQRGGVGDAGFERQDAPLAGGVFLDVTGDLGAGADEAHLANEDIPELRQFIELEFAEEPAQAGDARVAVPGHTGACFLRIHRHGPEFEDEKGLAPLPDSQLTKEDRAGVGELDRQGEQEEERAQRRQAEGRKGNIESPFQAVGRSGKRPGASGEGPRAGWMPAQAAKHEGLSPIITFRVFPPGPLDGEPSAQRQERVKQRMQNHEIVKGPDGKPHSQLEVFQPGRLLDRLESVANQVHCGPVGGLSW